MKKQTLAIIAATLITVGTGRTQQPPPAPAPAAPATPAPGRGGGGGFRQPDPIQFDDHTGWIQMFDGTTFNNWDGDFNIWRIENGAIVSESSCTE